MLFCFARWPIRRLLAALTFMPEAKALNLNKARGKSRLKR